MTVHSTFNVFLVILDVTKDGKAVLNVGGRGRSGMIGVTKVGIVTGILVHTPGTIGSGAVPVVIIGLSVLDPTAKGSIHFAPILIGIKGRKVGGQVNDLGLGLIVKDASHAGCIGFEFVLSRVGFDFVIEARTARVVFVVKLGALFRNVGKVKSFGSGLVCLGAQSLDLGSSVRGVSGTEKIHNHGIHISDVASRALEIIDGIAKSGVFAMIVEANVKVSHCKIGCAMTTSYGEVAVAVVVVVVVVSIFQRSRRTYKEVRMLCMFV